MMHKWMNATRHRIPILLLLAAWIAPPSGAELVLVADGESRAPIVIFEAAPPLTRRSADELAEYMEKISGVRPEVVEGEPDPLPEKAIWIGYQPVLDGLFPDLDFDFQHPEEILIAANARHLVIAGRDVWDPSYLTVDLGRRALEGVQQEYGTHNAVYTFLHDYLNVRWLWPDPMALDILQQDVIAFAPFVYRYHPQVRGRTGLFGYSQLHRAGPNERPATRGGPSSGHWTRVQRLQLDSLSWEQGGGHGFGDWWNRFHDTRPELFALQPDGTRSGHPSPGNAKMCHANPAVAEQWLDDVASELERYPHRNVFNASPNDGWQAGHCICEDCRAWDHPDGELRRFQWQGLSQMYVALSDRDVTFANRVARGLRERYPDKDFFVYMLAYGHSRPAPIAAVPDDNVIIGNVANFLLRSEKTDRGSSTGKTHRENFGEWGRVTQQHFWRPNLGSPVGFQRGKPDLPLQRTIEDMQFAAENGWMGIYADYVREHWATQAPLYYLMAHLTWNPHQDGQAILKDFYQRAYGPAAEAMEAYWTYLETLRETFIETYGYSRGRRVDPSDFYTAERLAEADQHLRAAMAKAEAAEDPRFRPRIDFARAGFEYTRLLNECARLMERVNAGEDEDGAARVRVLANWEHIRELQASHPSAMRWRRIFSRFDGSGPPALGARFHP